MNHIPKKGTCLTVEVNSDDPETALIDALDQVMKRFADIDLSLDDCGRVRAARWLAARYTPTNLFYPQAATITQPTSEE